MRNMCISATALALCAALALSCSNTSSGSPGTGDPGTGNPGTGGTPSHTYGDASTSFSALTSALVAAGQTTNSSASAYYTTDGTVFVYHFNSYASNGITCNGSLTMTLATGNINGTITFSGSNVSSIAYNNVNTATTPNSGIYSIVFTDGSSWSYNYATGIFSGS
jgi:hypothetical protein